MNHLNAMMQEITQTIETLTAGQTIDFPSLCQYRSYYDREIESGRTPPVTIDRARELCPELITMAALDVEVLAGRISPPTIMGDGEIRTRLLTTAAQVLGARGGAATKGISSPRKARSSRRNGKLGGRPLSQAN